MIIWLNSFSGRLVISISFHSFSEILSSSLDWNMSPLFFFLLILCVCFDALGKVAKSPSLDEWLYVGDILWGCHHR